MPEHWSKTKSALGAHSASAKEEAEWENRLLGGSSILRKKSANTRNPGWYYATCTENTISALITRIIETIYMYLYNSYSNNNTIIL